MTSAVYEPERVLLTIEGHCGAAQYGSDLICAMVSALAQTLAEWAEQRGSDRVEVRPGYVEIRGKAEDRIVFDAFALGLQCIAEQYPSNLEYVRIEE